MKTIYYLKAADQGELYAALLEACLVTEVITESGEHHAYQTAPGVELDVIGTIHKSTNVVDEFGMPIMEATEGYHANLLADLTPEQEALLPLMAAPATPYRVWA